MNSQLPPSSFSAETEQMAEKNRRMAKYFVGVILVMFLFGWGSIPLYRWVCAQVNPGGSSWFNGNPDEYVGVDIDKSRTIRVRFATNVERQLPWGFYSEDVYVDVHPGEKKLVRFFSENLDQSRAIKGKAVYDINPPKAGRHFKKIECFCFIEQTLEGGEKVEMPLYFWFDPELPEHINEITLAYTFFSAESSMARSMQSQ